MVNLAWRYRRGFMEVVVFELYLEEERISPRKSWMRVTIANQYSMAQEFGLSTWLFNTEIKDGWKKA